MNKNTYKVAWISVPIELRGGNIERFKLWSKYIDFSKFDIHLFSSSRNLDINYLREQFPVELQITHFKTHNYLGILRVFRRLVPIMLNNDFDLFVNLKPFSDIATGYAKKIVNANPPVVSMTGGKRIRTSPTKENIYKAMLSPIESQIGQYLTVSDYNKKLLSSDYKIDSEKIIVHRIGVEVNNNTHHLQFSNEDHREKLTFGWAGRMASEKGVNYFLDAIKLLKNEISSDFEDLNFIIAGRGPQKREWLNYAKELGLKKYIEFKGWFENIGEFFNLIDVLVLPSVEEGTPRIILEAYARRVPVIATDICGVSEIVIQNVTGLLVPSKNKEELYCAMNYFLNNKSEIDKFGEAGRDYVVRNHDIRKTTKKIQEVFISALSGRYN